MQPHAAQGPLPNGTWLGGGGSASPTPHLARCLLPGSGACRRKHTCIAQTWGRDRGRGRVRPCNLCRLRLLVTTCACSRMHARMRLAPGRGGPLRRLALLAMGGPAHTLRGGGREGEAGRAGAPAQHSTAAALSLPLPSMRCFTLPRLRPRVCGCAGRPHTRRPAARHRTRMRCGPCTVHACMHGR